METSSVQSQNVKYLENRKKQYIDMTHAPRRPYGQVTYSDQKLSICICRDDCIVPVENSMYVIHHAPQKGVLNKIRT